jgi:hypothetical protein
LGCTPRMRQKVKGHQHRVEKSSCLRPIVVSQSAAVSEAEAGSAGEQPARNSQLETHGDDWRRGRRMLVSLPLHQPSPPHYEFPNASENSCFRYAPSQMIECCILPTGKERLTAIRGTTLGGRHTIVDAALFWAISRKPRVLCLQKRIYQPNSGWSFCAASRRSLEPAVSSAVKGAAEFSGRITNGRCCFKMA